VQIFCVADWETLSQSEAFTDDCLIDSVQPARFHSRLLICMMLHGHWQQRARLLATVIRIKGTKQLSKCISHGTSLRTISATACFWLVQTSRWVSEWLNIRTCYERVCSNITRLTCLQNILDRAVVVQLRIWELPGSNLDPETRDQLYRLYQFNC
jgi:hypothetical protein